MKREVFWKNPGYKTRPELKQNISCDYLIVGGGVLGVSLAYFLSKGGAKNIVLIEKDQIASGATGKAAGMITISGELDLRDVILNHGRIRGETFWKSNHEGLRVMLNIIKKEKVRCDFELQGTIYGGLKGENHKFILEEFAYKNEVEKDTELLSELVTDAEIHKKIKTELFKYAIYSPGHGISVNPLQYTQNLSLKLDKKKVNLFEKTPLIKIKENVAYTPKGKIHFKNAVLALDVNIKNKKVKNRQSTIAITRKLSNKEVNEIGLKEKKFVWTTRDRYEYLKLTKENRLLIGFGDKTVTKSHVGIAPNPAHLKRIKLFLKELFPQISPEIEYAWSGNYGVTEDYIPVIDVKGDVLSVGGSSSQLVCTITAKYLADKFLDKHTTLDKFFLS